ncbi:replication initiator protein A [Burkholderia stabilis]|uniref:replication initiator protein A n=1 Tax=Burkholderia stabilis TaxID=95485 RepID=UPI001FC88591|nr:replication initiator protein A [Burkholderia stabilis]
MSTSKALALCQRRTKEALERVRRNNESHEDRASATAPVSEALSDQRADQVWKNMSSKSVVSACTRKPANDVVPSKLSPIRHAQQDFFVADLCDVALKDDMASMEHPLFALKAGDRRVRRYVNERSGHYVVVKPGSDGCATILDKDIWIYCISQMVPALDRGRDVSRTIRFTAYDFLVTTNRPTSGVGYARMVDALRRLKGTFFETNIPTGGENKVDLVGLIDHATVIKGGNDNRMVAVEVTLPEWLWRSVQARDVLTLSRDYFRLRKPLDRRIYELARKHCGRKQSKWPVSVTILHNKSGTTGSLREFRRHIKALANADQFLGYQVSLNAQRDTVTFYARSAKGAKARFDDILGTVRSNAGGKTAEPKTSMTRNDERQKHVKSRRPCNDERTNKGLISVHTAGVTGSIPVPPTKEFKALRLTTQGLFVLATQNLRLPASTCLEGHLPQTNRCLEFSRRASRHPDVRPGQPGRRSAVFQNNSTPPIKILRTNNLLECLAIDTAPFAEHRQPALPIKIRRMDCKPQSVAIRTPAKRRPVGAFNPSGTGTKLRCFIRSTRFFQA